MAELPFPPQEVARRLLDWYGRAGRDLPWRQTRDPYRIWLSEIMLQQTTVAAVLGYYRRFLADFPDVQSLAAAPIEAVIDRWAGLGYYARARNLHAAAIMVVETFGGVFPATVAELQQLPGVGRSTAGAIAALAFDQRAPILDGNVRRILCRLFALQLPSRSTAAEKQLWQWAEALTPAEGVHDYTQAIMDLGAIICLPRSPRCDDCPLQELCQAHAQKLVEQLPLKTKGQPVPVRLEVALLLECRGRYLVRRRPARGLLGGLLEFPVASVAQGNTPETVARRLAEEFAAAGEPAFLGGISHVYSHFRLDLRLYHLSVADLPRIAEPGDSDWCAVAALPQLALHGAHKKALGLLP